MSSKRKRHYRKIWEDHYGQIPKDDLGRTYEIHHLDGDHTNNNINNLICVSIQEHYQIHYDQNDWDACTAIAMRMTIDPKEKSEICRKATLNRVQSLDYVNPFSKRSDGTSVQTDRVKNGTHHWLGGEIQRRTQQNLVAAGKHHNQYGDGAQRQLKNGTHPSQLLVSCIYCKETHTKMIFARDHGENCWMITGRKSIEINGIMYDSLKIAATELNITEHQASVLSNGKTPRPAFLFDGQQYRSVLAAMKATGLTRYEIEKLGEKVHYK